MTDRKEELRRQVAPPMDLVFAIAARVDQYTAEHNGLMVIEVLAALELIRFYLTEDFIGKYKVDREKP